MAGRDGWAGSVTVSLHVAAGRLAHAATTGSTFVEPEPIDEALRHVYRTLLDNDAFDHCVDDKRVP